MPTHRPLCAPLFLLLLVFAAGCGGGSAGFAPSASTVVLFPPGRAITPAPTITVRGVVADPADVIALTVAGVAAASTDGFATWQASVPLTEGDNPLAVMVDRGAGPTEEASIVVRREGPAPTRIQDSAFDPAGDVLYLIDRTGRILAIDVQTGVRRLVTDQVTLPDAVGTARLAFAAGALYLSHQNDGEHRVTVIQPATGALTVLAQTGDGNGPDVDLGRNSDPSVAVAVDAVAGLALIVDHDSGNGFDYRVLSIDLVTAARAVLARVPDVGEVEWRYSDIASAPGTGTAYLVDARADTLHTVDLATGALVPVLSGLQDTAVPPPHVTADPTGGRIFYSLSSEVYEAVLATGVEALVSARPPRYSELDSLDARTLQYRPADGMLLGIANNLTALVEIDPTTGARRVLHEIAGTGARLRVDDLTLVDGRGLALCDDSGERITEVALPGGERSLLSGGGVGSGPLLDGIQGIVPVFGQDAVYVVDADVSPNPVYRVDLTTGTRVLVSGAGQGVGVDICYAIDMEQAADGTLHIFDEDDAQIVGVDPATGDRYQVAGDSTGSGPSLDGVRGGWYDDATDTIYACMDESILSVDPTTGNRTVFLDGSVYAQPRIIEPKDVFVSEDGADLWFVDDGDETLQHVDVATGTPTVVLDPATTTGFPLERPVRLAGRPGTGVLFVTDIRWDAVFAVDVTTGESVLVAR